MGCRIFIIIILLVLTPLLGGWAIRGEAQVSAPVLGAPDPVTSLENDRPHVSV
jgi:hypothetical protein